MRMFWFFFFVMIGHADAQSLAEAGQSAILNVMKHQEDCWNEGDIPCFMEGYWKSDSLKFIGSNGVTYGWKQTLQNYQKRYPDRAAMGKLSFEIISLEALGPESALLVGKWHLQRGTAGHEDIGGHFSLTWKKIEGKWLIIADHTS